MLRPLRESERHHAAEGLRSPSSMGYGVPSPSLCLNSFPALNRSSSTRRLSTARAMSWPGPNFTIARSPSLFFKSKLVLS
jgi:hypothetical protein